MRKQTSLPDFHELCTPEQNHIANVISLEIFFFFLCSVGGFLWEVLLMYVLEGRYVNRGFLYGPWLPVYGTGAVLFHALLAPRPLLVEPFSDSTDCATFSMRQQKKLRFCSHLRRFIVLFFLSALLGSIIEFAVGYFLAVTWGLRYWDYSGCFLNFGGYVCIWSALGFGIAGALWIGVLSDIFRRFFFRLSAKTRRNLNTILLLLFVLDCAAALIFPNRGYSVTFP